MKVPHWLRDTGGVDLGGGIFEWAVVVVLTAIGLFIVWSLYNLLFPIG